MRWALPWLCVWLLSLSVPVSAQLRFGPGYTGRVLSQGPASRAGAGMTFDPGGGLWVTNILDHAIRRLNPRTGAILEEVGFDQGVRTPDDVVFGSDGTMYWTNFLSGDVGKRTPDGTASFIGNVGEGADGIAVFPDGRLFVGRFLVGDELFEIDPAGVQPPRLVASGLVGLEGLDAGPDGGVYAAMIFTGEVIRVGRDSGAVSVFASGLDQPIAVRFGPDGALYVLEYLTGRVLRLRHANATPELVATTDVGVDGLDFDPAGVLYTSNWVNGRVERIRHGRRATVVEGGLVAAGGLAVTGHGWHTRVWSAEVSTLRSTGAALGEQRDVFPTVFNDGTAALSLPFTVAPHGDDLVTTSWFANAVQVIDRETGALVSAHLDFAAPMNAVSFRGDLVVAEAGTGEVVRFDPVSGARHTIGSGLALPIGLAADDRSLFAADWGTGTVWALAANGRPLSAPRVRATDLLAPEGMALGRDGTLYVCETGRNRVVALDRSGRRTVVVSRLPAGIPAVEGFLPTWTLCDVALDAAGLIYVSVPGANQILQIREDCR